MKIVVMIEESQEGLYRAYLSEINGPFAISQWEPTYEEAERAGRNWIGKMMGHTSLLEFRRIRRWSN